jgi:hypothetical protein
MVCTLKVQALEVRGERVLSAVAIRIKEDTNLPAVLVGDGK